jgi:AcrR family transcriptional regulator
MPATRGRYGGVDATERVATRRAKLTDAALELLGTDGWPATTVRGICAHARLTPRYFYESFEDRDAIVLAVFDEIAADAARAVMEAVVAAPVVAAPADARAKSRAAIGAFIELITDDPRKARVLFIEAMGSESLARRRFETVRMFARLVAEQARAFYNVPNEPDPLVELTALMLAGGLAEAILAWLDGTLRITREQLIEDCTDLFVANGEAAVRLVNGRRADT